MTTCDHRLWDDTNGLACTRTDPHQAGHVYRPSSGLAPTTPRTAPLAAEQGAEAPGGHRDDERASDRRNEGDE